MAPYKIIFSVYIAVTAILAVTTFISPDHQVYDTWWFGSLWLLWAIGLVVAIRFGKMVKYWPSVVLHAAFLVILAGGLATWTAAENTRMRLSPGQKVEVNGSMVKLDSFVVVQYPGTAVPRDYRSYLDINGRKAVVSVNKPVYIGNTKLWQFSYDANGASTLGVSSDFPGRYITYAGYVLFVIGFVLVMAVKGGRFRKLLGLTSLALLLPMQAGAVPGVSRGDAKELSVKQVLYNGRVVPLSTPANEFMIRVAGCRSLGGATAEQVVLSMTLYPDEWNTQPIIQIKDSKVRHALSIESEYASVADFFDFDGNYRIAALYKGDGSKLDKQLLDLDERMEVVLKVQRGELFSPLPVGTKKLPAWRVRLEIMRNHMEFCKLFFMAALALGLAMMLSRRRWLSIIGWALVAWQAAGWIIQWIVAGHVPLTNGGETLVFLSVMLMAVSLPWPRLASLGTLMAGFAALAGWLSLRTPAMTPMMPVLHSPWLSIHVALVMTAYALLTMTFVMSVASLVRPKIENRSLLLLYPGLLLLGMGIFAGAVWADIAWGRYWSWDPKETWALITLLVYAIPLHPQTGLNGRKLSIFLVAAFLTVLMTYFGVNWLPSLHAYG